MKNRGLFLFLFAVLPVLLQAQNRYDVVISEIMADPAPPVGLPNNEWLELRNTTALPVNLQNWRIGDATGTSGAFPSFILQPDSSVIICTGSAIAAMSAFGATIAVTSFPSLDNEGDQLFLRAANGRTIHAVNYSAGWYQNALKKEGGWTLEIIDSRSPCAGMENWKASVHVSGGTPGKKNSVDAVNSDTEVPRLKRAYTTDNTTIILVYDEPVDSSSGATLSNYSADGGLVCSSAATLPPLFNMVQLKTTVPLSANTVYTITANNIKDCSGNSIGLINKAKVGLPVDPSPGEWIINEVLFNPRSNAYDFVEFYNNSGKIFDASELYIANRNSSGAISSVKPLSMVPFYIFPGDYIVETEDAASLSLQYMVPNPGQVLVVSSPPSFPDTEGDVIALNFQGDITDELRYKDDWHFKLIDNAEGISLERIDPDGSSLDPLNWHSAASTTGYATPTAKNSQYRLLSSIIATISITPKVFSPDNDGRDDVATIQYAVTAPGYVANIIVFDAAGRPVKHLVQNGTLGLTGHWTWDGLDDAGKRLPIGIYIVLTEIFNLRGEVERFKNVIVLARKL